MPGPLPQKHHSRARDGHKLTKVAAPAAGVRPLNDDLLEPDETWHPATHRWWTSWVESPLSAEWPATDWAEMETLAVLHHRFMGGASGLAAEMRLRSAAFGATPADRLRLKIKVVPQTAEVPSISDRRARLSG